MSNDIAAKPVISCYIQLFFLKLLGREVNITEIKDINLNPQL